MPRRTSLPVGAEVFQRSSWSTSIRCSASPDGLPGLRIVTIRKKYSPASTRCDTACRCMPEIVTRPSASQNSGVDDQRNHASSSRVFVASSGSPLSSRTMGCGLMPVPTMLRAYAF